jgi:hypothetical protein
MAPIGTCRQYDLYVARAANSCFIKMLDS